MPVPYIICKNLGWWLPGVQAVNEAHSRISAGIREGILRTYAKASRLFCSS
jgi:hypothetical protein